MFWLYIALPSTTSLFSGVWCYIIAFLIYQRKYWNIKKHFGITPVFFKKENKVVYCSFYIFALLNTLGFIGFIFIYQFYESDYIYYLITILVIYISSIIVLIILYIKFNKNYTKNIIYTKDQEIDSLITNNLELAKEYDLISIDKYLDIIQNKIVKKMLVLVQNNYLKKINGDLNNQELIKLYLYYIRNNAYVLDQMTKTEVHKNYNIINYMDEIKKMMLQNFWYNVYNSSKKQDN
ncbi:hypothetical protein SHELI_v1c04480 [Spiroplasma helicoides]|uniref:Uncharacterized protein n=1 Tax=Spiroplasma helicoides TaxID=216938 RepID=A0A1B3SKF6_9MOLU|nr:hypothetical protein [Spiroplasma helicoides]AOG60399.1 hypothetical protein SHELI_v1c04480 [Spiroplasma helicoides]